MYKSKSTVIRKTLAYVKKKLTGEGSGHDFWHVYRVWKNAKMILKNEKADGFVVELAALLHDIADWKFNGGDEAIGARRAGQWLRKMDVAVETIKHVEEIIAGSSFKGAKVSAKMRTIEGKIMQDADRLDAMGAIGIARTFTFGGALGREIYNPAVKPSVHKTKEEYLKNSGSTINHFYEKLLLLKDLMNTKTAKKIAVNRHKFMIDFLKEFYREAEYKG